ncbi:MAG: cysteine desulfurase family protein, partial [Paracoccaceae bacterium]
RVHVAAVEHDAVFSPATASVGHRILAVDANGRVPEYQHDGDEAVDEGDLVCVQAANSETGVEQNWYGPGFLAMDTGAKALVDFAQVAGRIWGRAISDPPSAHFKLVSAHKFGGPVGTGALILDRGDPVPAPILGGGQEQGRRSGTENVIGIAGFGAAAEAAQRDLEEGAWDRVAIRRDRLEERLAGEAPDLIIFGKDSPRLPNTSCFAVPGWKGETQVMQMDLAGFAVSAGSACSSGKVGKASRVLMAMGFDELTASSAIRVSMGPATTEAEVMAFADTWIDHYRRRRERAA